MQASSRGTVEPFDASDWKVGIVVAQFNSDITQSLHESALKRATDYRIPKENIDTTWVAGAIEIPLVLQHMVASGQYQALLAIGCVINGATPHFEYVCKYVTEGILRVQLDFSMPIGFGVLTCGTKEQAVERAGLGGEHLDAVLQQAKLLS